MLNTFLRSFFAAVLLSLVVIRYGGPLVDKYRIQPLPPAPTREWFYKPGQAEFTYCPQGCFDLSATQWISVHFPASVITRRSAQGDKLLQETKATLSTLAIKHPELTRTYIFPALDDVIKLQSMKVTDKGYEDAFDQLHADMMAIDNALKNYWI
jgi:hypothetical protein